MKIIEALKELPLIDKKIEKNISLIGVYSSEMGIGDDPKFTFGDTAAQIQEVQSLIQSTNDLVSRKAELRRALAITNCEVVVTIKGVQKTIAEWIEYRQKGVDVQIRAVNALTMNNANQQLHNNGKAIDVSQGVKVYRFFDEKVKNDTLNNLMELKAAIDPQLEIVNATTDLSVEV